MYKIYADETLIYDSTLDDFRIGKGAVSLEADKPGSFEFSVFPGHFYYDSFAELKTIITVYKAGKIKFRGRVLTAVSDYWNNKVLTCEGERAFLEDTVIRPFSFSGTPGELFAKFITDHNGQVEEAKRFKLGTVSVEALSGSGWAKTTHETTLACLNTCLLEDAGLGGHLYITHGDDGKDPIPTIHYIKDFPVTASQSIEFGVNLRSFTKTLGAEQVATAIVPLGATVDDGNSDTEDPKLTIAKVNNGVDYVYDAAAVERYGWIFRIVAWDDITDPALLKSTAQLYLKSLISPILSVDLTALDMNLFDRSIESYNVCEYIPVSSIPHKFAATLLCSKQTFDLLKPENDSVTLGHSYPTFTESSTKAISKAAQIGKTAGSALINSAVIVEIISRLDALEGVSVIVTTSDALDELDTLFASGSLMVAGRIVNTADTSIVVTGGQAAVTYTLSAALDTARVVTVNGVTLGAVQALGDSVSTTIPVNAGSNLVITFAGG